MKISVLAPRRLRSALLSLLAAAPLPWVASGCGVPGEPLPPLPPIPTAVNDLTAKQLGEGVLLSFTLPTRSTLGERLTETPTIEVFRGSLRPDGTPDPKSFRQVDTVPSTVLSGYLKQGTVGFTDTVSTEQTRSHPGEVAVYSVRTRVSERRGSADSNFARVNLYPVQERIAAVDVQVTEKSLQLRWTAPAQASGGAGLPAISEYHVYRGELDPASLANAENDLHTAIWKLPPLLIAAPTEPEYQDTGFDYGKTYVYIVRSVVNEAGVTRESSDSQPAIVTPRDTFPPAAPRDLVAAVLPGAAAGSSVVDLSWSLNVETDLAGYHVYRSESEDQRGQLLASELLPTPAYRDNTPQTGRKYWYTVTAADRAGNESGPSAAAAVEIP
jgi:hypothetical protein